MLAYDVIDYVKEKLLGTSTLVRKILECQKACPSEIYLTGSTVLSAFVPFTPNDHDIFCSHKGADMIFSLLEDVIIEKSNEYINMNFTSHGYSVVEGSEHIDLVVCPDPLRSISMFDLSNLKLAFDGKKLYHPEDWDPYECRVLFSANDSDAPFVYPEEFGITGMGIFHGSGFRAHMRALQRALKYQNRGIQLIDDRGRNMRIPKFDEIGSKMFQLFDVWRQGLLFHFDRGLDMWKRYLSFGGRYDDVVKKEWVMDIAGDALPFVYLQLKGLPESIAESILSYNRVLNIEDSEPE